MAHRLPAAPFSITFFFRYYLLNLFFNLSTAQASFDFSSDILQFICQRSKLQLQLLIGFQFFKISDFFLDKHNQETDQQPNTANPHRVYADCVRYNTAQRRPNSKYQNKGIRLKASLPDFFILRFRLGAPQIRRTS